jgi:hypothetical protein
MKSLLAIIFGLLLALPLFAQTNPAPVRLAIISESPEAAAAADVLTAEFTKNERVQLLERTEIEKVYHEQGLSAANKDYLKLGQILGADGLLLLDTAMEGTTRFLNVRLVAVKPGVALVTEKFAWPVANLAEWSPAFTRHLNPLLPKLAILPKDAIPISVVNLRSSIQSEAAKETERQLKLLAIQRLSQEPRLFVLERQQLQLLTGEKELKSDDSAFWSGSYLVDGTVDQNGYAQDTVTINARLTPPKGGTPVLIETSGSRTNLAKVINDLAAKVIASLKINPAVKEWNADDEAAQYFDEARWAIRWGIYPEAQAATESAWALGRQNSDSGILLIRAYAESFPEHPLNMNEIAVLAIPDAGRFAPLDRALEVFTQNAPLLFAGPAATNASAFKLGFQLLRRGAGQLESYYYAAEARTGHEAELLALRERMRLAFKVMEAHPFSGKDPFHSWPDLGQQYKKLKWEEGGVCFDHPESALSFYNDLLDSAARPEHLPRLVGWSWADRQHVPALLHRFVAEACAHTNPAVRLEGLYQAMLLAPDDEQGSLRRCEQGLESAMWENRDVLYRNPDAASLVERTRHSLCDFEGYSDIYKPYGHEPFASFKHRLRMDFLANTTNPAPETIWELFPSTSEKMETSEQARELLPLAVNCLEKSTPSKALKIAFRVLIEDLHRSAGIVETNVLPPAKPVAQPAEDVFEAKFVKWNLPRQGFEMRCVPRFNGMIVRDGTMWLQVRYEAQNHGPYSSWDIQNSSYIAVDPQMGVKTEIPFPDRLGVPGEMFEVNSNMLFVEAGGHLLGYDFRGGNWTEISVPMEGSSQLVWLKDRLFINRSDGLLTVQPESKQVEVLVSSRRTPPANEVDPLWTDQTRIYRRADDRLGALSADSCFTYDSDTGRWNVRQFPQTSLRKTFNFWLSFLSPDGAQWYLSNPMTGRYLVGFWNGENLPETLLAEPAHYGTNHTFMEKRLQPVRWDWPQPFPLEPSSILAEEKKLWVLSPRNTWDTFRPEEPVKFSDTRQATLFYFEPEFRQPLSAAIHFEEIPAAELPHINNQVLDMLAPPVFQQWHRFETHAGNMGFWLKTPEGLVYGAPHFSGHWLIPNAALETRFQAQRERLRLTSKPTAAPPAIPKTP